MSKLNNQYQESDAIIEHTAGSENLETGEGGGHSHLQDMLLHAVKGIAYFAHELASSGPIGEDVDTFVLENLVATMNHSQFDSDNVEERIRYGLKLRDDLRANYEGIVGSGGVGRGSRGQYPDAAVWSLESDDLSLEEMAPDILGSKDVNRDVQSLRDLIVIGAKGIATYVRSARELDFIDRKIVEFLYRALASTLNDALTINELLDLVLEEGQMAVNALDLLDHANTDSYGNPEPTDVPTKSGKRPGILIAGHDLRDLEDLLLQTEGTNIDVYTHGEMLSAHAYPSFKGFDHFVGNYGGSWTNQNEEFEMFNGPIVITSKCVIPMVQDFKDRVFTTGHVNLPGIPHIENRIANGNWEPAKDFSSVITRARQSSPPVSLDENVIPIGCGRETLLSTLESVIYSIKNELISKIVVIMGCDGGTKHSDYYTNLLSRLPGDSIILTAGCIKYQFNRTELGEIQGIPRLLDAGQCTEIYAIAKMLLELANQMGAQSINGLPVSLEVSLLEQKSMAILFALLHLGIRGIRVGPIRAIQFTPGVEKLFQEKFDIHFVQL